MYQRLAANQLGIPQGYVKQAIEKLESSQEVKRLQAAVKVITVNSDQEQNLANFLRRPESAEFMEYWTGFPDAWRNPLPDRSALVVSSGRWRCLS